MEVKIFDVLPPDAVKIRTEVFMTEQGFVNEMDETDNIAVHLVLYDGKLPVATCRIFRDEEMKTYMLGRLAVIKPYRGKQLGAEMIKHAEKYVRDNGGENITLHAQCRVSAFYRKQGYNEQGEIGYEEGCPHIWMKKELC